MTAGEDRFLHAEVVAEAGPYAAIQILGFSIEFVLRNIFRCLKVTIVPLTFGGFILFGLLSAYLSQLTEYLNHPTGEVASRVLGIAAAVPLVMVLIHSLIIANLAEVVLGQKVDGPSFLGIRQWEWRLYVANLSLLLLAAAVLIVFLLPLYFMALRWPYHVGGVIECFLAACLFWLFFRAWFFVLPICMETHESEVLIRSWKKSTSRQLLLATVLFPTFVIVFLIQVGAERLLRASHIISVHDVGVSISANIAFLRANLLPFIGLFGITYLLAVLLCTPARIQAYRRSSEGCGGI